MKGKEGNDKSVSEAFATKRKQRKEAPKTGKQVAAVLHQTYPIVEIKLVVKESSENLRRRLVLPTPI